MNSNSIDNNMPDGGRFKERLRDRIEGSVARNQQERERLRVQLWKQLMQFIHARGRLWFGLPAVALITFLFFFLLRTLDLPVAEALAKGGKAAGIVSLWWVVGIWTSTNDLSAKKEMEEEDKKDPLWRWFERLKQRSVVNRLLRGLGVLLSVAVSVFVSVSDAESADVMAIAMNSAITVISGISMTIVLLIFRWISFLRRSLARRSWAIFLFSFFIVCQSSFL